MNSRKIKPTLAFIVLFLLGFVWINAGWTAPEKQYILQASPTLPLSTATLASDPTSTVTTTPTFRPTPTLTPLPAEYQETPDQTIGILFGAVFLVIIIVGGTFFTIRRKR